MAISRKQLIQKVRNRLGEPMVKVEICDNQISEHIDYARQKWIKWAIGNATQDTYFTIMLQAGKTLYDLPAGVVSVVEYDDQPIRSGGINTLFTIENFMFAKGFFGNAFYGGYDLISYHIVLDFLETLKKYTPSPYNWKYHKSTNQLEINPAPPVNEGQIIRYGDHPDTGLPQEYVFDSPGFVLVRAYMIEGSTLPNYTPDWTDTLKEVKTIIEKHTIGAPELAQKYFILEHTPTLDYSDKMDYNVPEDIKMVVNGQEVTKYLDFDQLATNKKIITWEDMNLDGVIQEGDEVTVSYPVIFQSEYYPDEWTNVTATSTEVEQITLNQADINRKSVRVYWPIWGSNVKVSTGTNTYELSIEDLGTDFIVDPNDPKKISWDGLALEGELSVGDQITITYVGIRSQRPNNMTADTSKIHQYTTRIENREITADEITNQALVLEDPVAVGDGMRMTLGSFERVYGIDFRLDGTQTVAWDGLGLDGTISAGDKVTITYTSANYFEREVEEELYDEDWILDYVTALSKITLGLIRRKLANFSSLGNQGISLDGDSMVSDGQAEKEYLEETLRDEEAHEGYGIEIGIM